MRRFLPLILVGLIASGIVAYAASPGIINQYNALCGANTPTYCAQPDSSGNLPVTGTISGTVSVGATATAAAPSYVEATSNPFSQNLTGDLRTIAKQSTSPWIVAGGGTAGSAATGVVTVQGIASATPVIMTGSGTAGSAATGVVTVQGIASGTAQPVSGTFFQATQPVSIASGQVASGAISSGAVASGAVASGAYASGSIASGALAVGSITNGADVALGLTTDAKSTATDTTAATLISITKEISALEQAPVSRAVTNAGTFAVQSTPAVSTAGGVTTTYVVEPAASDNHVVIKAGAGNVYWMSAFNNSATINYIRLYNATTGFNGCNSATNLIWEGHIPASTSDAGFIQNFNTPISFATGISICVTGAYGQTNTTNATASAISITIGYN